MNTENTRTGQLLNSLMFLKELKVPGEMRTNEIEIRNVLHKVENQHIDESFIEKIKSLVGDTKFRIKRVGGMYTQDIRRDRLNFVVDRDFNLTDIYWG